jgi:hypothetical protein
VTLQSGSITASEACPGTAVGSAPECVTVTLDLGGGNILFTYQSVPTKTISYAFHGVFGSRHRGAGGHGGATATIGGRGSLQLTELPSNVCVSTVNPTGVVVLKGRTHLGPFSVRMKPSVNGDDLYCGKPPKGYVDLAYEVTQSNLACLPAGRGISIRARFRMNGVARAGTISIPDLRGCGLLDTDYVAAVKITVS